VHLAWLSRIICASMTLAISTHCLAGSLSSYRVAVELKADSAASDLDYETVKASPMPDACREKVTDPSMMICTTSMGKTGKLSYALSLQQEFKRTGWGYFSGDFGGSLFLLDAKASEQTSKTNAETQTQYSIIPQPLQKARIHLYGANAKAFIQFGITPPTIIPDFLISLGLGYHFSTGNLKIDDMREKLQIAAGIGYVQYEVVWWRFADGSLSSYLSQEFGANYRLKGEFGPYRDLHLKPSLASFGLLKLVLPFKTN
jgi:hypothetical protein